MGRHFAGIVLRIIRTTRSCNSKGHFAFIIYGLFCRVTSAYRGLETFGKDVPRICKDQNYKLLSLVKCIFLMIKSHIQYFIFF